MKMPRQATCPRLLQASIKLLQQLSRQSRCLQTITTLMGKLEPTFFLFVNFPSMTIKRPAFEEMPSDQEKSLQYEGPIYPFTGCAYRSVSILSFCQPIDRVIP